MAVRLGELLTQNNLLTKSQLEEALKAQVLFGGKLGTILIEMGLITENALVDLLSSLLKLPCAHPGDLLNIPPDVIKIITPDIAEQYQAVPMAIHGRKLTLAMANPQDLKAIDDISFRTGYIVRPVLGLEVRLVFALERYYDIKRPMRYIPPPKQVFHVLDRLEKLSAEENDSPPNPVSEQSHVFPEQGPSMSPTGGDIEELENEEVALEDTARALTEVRTRDDIADAAIRYLAAHFKRTALFMVVGSQVTGWRSALNGLPVASLDNFQRPAVEPSILKTCIDSQNYYLGPLPAEGANLALLAPLGKPVPATVLLLPLVMMERVVALIYLDDPEIDLHQALPTLQDLSAKIVLGFELLILHSKILRI